jgi:hypothetical protein
MPWLKVAKMSGGNPRLTAIIKVYTRAHGEPLFEDHVGPIFQLKAKSLLEDEQHRVGRCVRINSEGHIEELQEQR